MTLAVELRERCRFVKSNRPLMTCLSSVDMQAAKVATTTTTAPMDRNSWKRSGVSASESKPCGMLGNNPIARKPMIAPVKVTRNVILSSTEIGGRLRAAVVGSCGSGTPLC